MDTDGGNRASSSSSSSSSSQAAPISEAEMIEKLPKRLREPFEFTWEVPALCHYLLKKLSGFKDFTNDKLTAMECELSIFKDVVQDEIESRCEDRLVDIPNDYEKNVLAREMARSMIGWIQKWLKEQVLTSSAS
ncbi:hypothetical protein CAOG_08962 [Capsaspora owczarzaki ATCC 30864]|uniref:hypothetical protein n=1 Tax=Capsaspora owczarzaki (strain ATCC 30864) TaxID=595528 RepID=UPI0003524491|nr:hypothetical protein CAOG_08962 [Capsaspora owczarzaki ATCC 30864]|eukprot:XP_011270640.1 hypothetical protein CAOG_08962 [Capsaspora owczarzaki ATCC 30864]